MALESPGVQVTVIDESFYAPAEPGTTALVVVATGENKQNASGTGTAQGTLAANAGLVYRVTSQRELVDLFGVPKFYQTANGRPIHAGEQNEYGLQAAYSLLGVTNSVWIVRANVNLTELTASASIPGSEPTDGQWWFDTNDSLYGIAEWNGNAATTTGGQKFVSKTPMILTPDDTSKTETQQNGPRKPKASIGKFGDYAIVATDETITLYFRNNVDWFVVGSNEWAKSWATITGTKINPQLVQGETFTINGTLVTVPVSFDSNSPATALNSLVTTINGLSITGVTAAAVGGKLELYSDAATDINGDSARSNAIIIGAGTGGVVASLASSSNLGVAIGTYYGPELTMSPHTSVPGYKSSSQYPRPTGAVWIKTTSPNQGSSWSMRRWDSAVKAWVYYNAPLYANGQAANYGLDRAYGGLVIPRDQLYVQYNFEEDSGYDDTPQTATFKINRRRAGGATSITSGVIEADPARTGSRTFLIRESIPGSASLSDPVTISVSMAGTITDAETVATAINNSALDYIEASVVDVVAGSKVRLVITHKSGGEFRLKEGTGSPLSGFGFVVYNTTTNTGTVNLYDAPSADTYDYVASNWQPLVAVGYAASNSEPLNDAVDNQLWYFSKIDEVDIMVNNGTEWVGYKNYYTDSDPLGPIVSASKPTTRRDDSTLLNGDLWISTADIENYPQIYRFSADLQQYVLIDKTDQVTEDGIIFADARWATSGDNTVPSAIEDLLTSDYVDPDAPDPALYPTGMMLWNLRRSGFNVKRYAKNYIDIEGSNPRVVDINGGEEQMSTYWPDRWVTASENNADGSGSFGRKAQRKVVISAIKSVVDTNDDLRDEERRNFNLIAAPGYPEVFNNLVNLNLDRNLTSFVVGDTPFRLKPDATTLTYWGTNANGGLTLGDEGTGNAYDPYAALWYPSSGFTNDNLGNSIVVPSSHMLLKTITLSDQVSYPWFAPAGTRRGGIVNATAAGYVNAQTSEFVDVALNEGQRDTLYNIKVNPIAFFNGVGLVTYGQKTRARNASALDRINAARLVIYMRSQLSKLAKPYLFEPNDKITRDEIKQAVESLCLELVGLRALYDYVVVCDETNNTPQRIDRNELYVDIAIEPVKAIEFIYIPLRIKNTGEIKSGSSN